MSFILVSLFMVLVFWRPQEWLVPFLYGLPILDAVFYAALLALLVEIDQGRVSFPRRVPQPYMIAGLFVAALMSHIANTYYVGLINAFVPAFKICFFTFTLFIVLDQPWRLHLVGRIFVLMAAIMAVHALLQQSRGYGFAGHPMVVDDKGARSMFFGIFEDPNDLAQMLVTAMPFSFALTRRRSVPGFLAGVGLTWLLTLGVLATRSRGGMVGLAAMGAIMFTLLLPSRWMPFCFGALVVGFLLACPLAGAVMDDSAHDRVTFWGTANWAFRNNLFFGVGYGMLIEYIPKGRAVHSAFISCYSELGLFGYWFWFGLVQLGLLGCWRVRVAFRRPENAEQEWFRRFSGLCIAAMAGFAGSGYFLTRAFVYPAFFLFALLGALPIVAQKRLPPGYPLLIRPRRDLVVCTFGSLLSVAYIYFSIVLLNKAFFFG